MLDNPRRKTKIWTEISRGLEEFNIKVTFLYKYLFYTNNKNYMRMLDYLYFLLFTR